MEPVLTIAVPTFNMESCLAKNLATYCDQRLESRLEVICLNNASEDGSKEMICIHQQADRDQERRHTVAADVSCT